MRDRDRFAAFLQRQGARYNAPPETPVEGMWLGVEEGLGGNAVASSGATGGVGQAGAPAGGDLAADAPIPAPGYHTPPPPPRGEMWERIETDWALRRTAASASGDARAARRWRPAWTARRGTTGWVAALAAAASLVLGIALGRGTRDAQPGEMAVPTTVATPDAAMSEVMAPTVAAAEQEPGETEDPGTLSTEVAPAEMAAVATSFDIPEGVELEARSLVAVSAPVEFPAVQRDRFEPEHDYVTARHLGRAATLLTAFRTDRRTPESQQDLAQWARELLLDTRMFLGLSDFRSPIEQVLLEDLELVLIQIAGLGPGAPDFEWALARESMERRGTLTRLRAVSAEGEI